MSAKRPPPTESVLKARAIAKQQAYVRGTGLLTRPADVRARLLEKASAKLKKQVSVAPDALLATRALLENEMLLVLRDALRVAKRERGPKATPTAADLRRALCWRRERKWPEMDEDA